MMSGSRSSADSCKRSVLAELDPIETPAVREELSGSELGVLSNSQRRPPARLPRLSAARLSRGSSEEERSAPSYEFAGTDSIGSHERCSQPWGRRGRRKWTEPPRAALLPSHHILGERNDVCRLT